MSVELLAPAGSLASLEAVFAHGADAAYVGIGRSNLRAHAPALDADQLHEALDLAHTRQRRLYGVLNTMPNDDDLGEIQELLRFCVAHSTAPDAFIVSDPGVISLCRDIMPETPLHLSTQTGTFNRCSMAFWARQGISRVILPRELTLAQVAALSACGPLPTEVFAHGAMCVSVSGRCLMSAYLDGRHPNQGDCAQPCRLTYRVTRTPGCDHAAWFDAVEDERGVYLFNSRDLNTVPILGAIVGSGVGSIKIEGRNKSLHYLSCVVKVYRAALDRALADPVSYRPEPDWLRELERLDHREYTTGFYAGEQALQQPHGNKVPAGSRIVAVVREPIDATRVAVDVKNSFQAGEQLEVVPVSHARSAFYVVPSRLQTLQEDALEKALPNRLVVIQTAARLQTGDILRRVLHQDTDRNSEYPEHRSENETPHR